MLTTAEQLDLFTNWLEAGTPFFHTRYNDGELLSMFGMKSPKHTTSGEHHYTPGIGLALMNTWVEISRSQRSNIIVGSYVNDTFSHSGVSEKAAERFRTLLSKSPPSCVAWSQGDLWYSTQLEEQGKHEGPRLMRLIGILAELNDVILVGNANLSKIADRLKTQFVQVPMPDGWSADKSVIHECLQLVRPSSVFLWCAGFPGKVWAWKTWQHQPTSSHIDAGHLFDLACGHRTRDWMRRGEGAHFNYYQQEVMPYLLGS